ncbi:unnamed protein product, partial [Didymodactylos carnosus]
DSALPVTLLHILSKPLERVVDTQLYNYLTKNNLLTCQQSGFRHRDSTINQLIDFVHEVALGFEENKLTRAIFLDFKKAFDSVWHVGLLCKLKQKGVSNNTLN